MRSDRRILCIVLAAPCVLVAACSRANDGDGDAGGTATPTPTPSAPAPAVRETTCSSGDLEPAGDLYLPEGAAYDPIDEIVLAQDASIGGPVRALRSEHVEDGTMIGSGERDVLAFPDAAHRRGATTGDPVSQPLLVVGGELDTNVPPAQLDRWEQVLGDDRRVVELECVSHALNCLATDDMSAIVPADVGRTVAPAVSETMIEFLDSAL
jgi:pimeloyl-ACP methyl ester carboxylesterase